MTTVLAQLIDQRLLGARFGARVGLASGGGLAYAFLSPTTRALVVVDLRTPGVPLLAGTVTLPLEPKAITVDTATGRTLSIAGSETLWTVTLDATTYAPTLTSTVSMPAYGKGGVDQFDTAGTYLGTYGPLGKNMPMVSNATTLYAYAASRKLLLIYTVNATQPYLTLLDMVSVTGVQQVNSLRLGTEAGGNRLYIVSDDRVLTFDIATDPTTATLLTTVRHTEAVLSDLYSGQNPISLVYYLHLAGRPPIDGQAGAPTEIDAEDFITAINNAAGLLFIAVNRDLGKVTVWQ